MSSVPPLDKSASPDARALLWKKNSGELPGDASTLVTIGALNRTPRNSTCPDAPGGTKNCPRLVVPLRNSISLECDRSTSVKIAPNPRDASCTGVGVAALGLMKSVSMPTSLKCANVLCGENGLICPATPGFTLAKPSPATA